MSSVPPKDQAPNPMPSIEARLFLFDDLTGEERRAAEAYIEANPEAWSHVAAGRRLRAVLRAGAAAPPSDGLSGEPAHHGSEADDIQSGTPSSAQGGADMEARWEELEAHLPPAREHLAALIEEAEAESSARRAPRRALAPDRAPKHRSSRVRIPLVAALVLFTLGSALVVTSYTTQPDHERIAALAEVPETFPGLRLRGTDGQVDRVAETYATALETVHDGRSTTLGLFPRYDLARLGQAEALLTEVVEMNPLGPIGLEARFARARVLLYRGDAAAAAADFRAVVEHEGPSAPEARRKLSELARHGMLTP